MPQANDLSRCLTAVDQDSTLIAVIEMSQSSWLVAGILPGIERHPAKKLAPDEGGLLRLLHRWRGEAEKAGRNINRIAVAYEAGRDGFWLARWLRAQGIEAGACPVGLQPTDLIRGDVSKGQRPGSGVLSSHRRRARRHPQGADHCAGTQAARRSLFRPGAGLWRLVTTGEVPHGVVLRPTS